MIDSIGNDNYRLSKYESNFGFKSMNDMLVNSNNNIGVEESMKKFDDLHSNLHENN